MTTGPEAPVRDAALDAAWRAHSLDEPPAQLDAAIRAAAQAAVAAAPRDARAGAAGPARPRRWWMPLAAAAMLSAVVIGVSRLLPQDQAATAPFAVDLPERDAAPSGSPLPLEREEGSSRLPELGADVKLSKEAPAASGAVRFQASPASAPPPAGARLPVDRRAAPALEAITSDALAASEATRVERPSAPAPSLASEPPSASAAAAAPALAREAPARASAQGATALAADATLARIRELYAAGRLAEAAKQLIALRAALPDADRRLPPELQQWATTVEP
jgi:hypothetical protein